MTEKERTTRDMLAGSDMQGCILGVCKLKDHLLILVDLKKALEGVVAEKTAGDAREKVPAA